MLSLPVLLVAKQGTSKIGTGGRLIIPIIHLPLITSPSLKLGLSNTVSTMSNLYARLKVVKKQENLIMEFSTICEG
jgi:hypothetical protein